MRSLNGIERPREQGDADAQFFLGGMYGQGLGVTQDYIQAHKWYNLAGSSGDKVAAWEAAQELAREWMETTKDYLKLRY